MKKLVAVLALVVSLFALAYGFLIVDALRLYDLALQAPDPLAKEQLEQLDQETTLQLLKVVYSDNLHFKEQWQKNNAVLGGIILVYGGIVLFQAVILSWLVFASKEPSVQADKLKKNGETSA